MRKIKRAQMVNSYILWIILGLAILALVAFAIKKSDIINWVRDLPSYQYPTIDQEIDISRLRDVLGINVEIIGSIGCFGDKEGSKEGFIYTHPCQAKDAKTKFYFKGKNDDGNIHGIVWEDIGWGIRFGFDKKIGEAKNSIIKIYPKFLEDANYEFTKKLNGARIMNTGNAIIKEKGKKIDDVASADNQESTETEESNIEIVFVPISLDEETIAYSFDKLQNKEGEEYA